jgi:hypothetical protein
MRSLISQGTGDRQGTASLSSSPEPGFGAETLALIHVSLTKQMAHDSLFVVLVEMRLKKQQLAFSVLCLIGCHSPQPRGVRHDGVWEPRQTPPLMYGDTTALLPQCDTQVLAANSRDNRPPTKLF